MVVVIVVVVVGSSGEQMGSLLVVSRVEGMSTCRM